MVVFGPLDFSGLGLQPLPLIQGHRQLQAFITTLGRPTKITPQLQTLLRYTYLEAGTDTIINKRVLSYLTPTWVTSMLEFCVTNRVTITMPDRAAALPLQRTADSYIMQLFMNRQPNYSASELRSLNRVRMSLQVYSMACCITTEHAGSLRDSIRSQRLSLCIPKSTLAWPQAKATTHDWAVWKRAVHDTMGVYLGTCATYVVWGIITLYYNPNLVKCEPRLSAKKIMMLGVRTYVSEVLL